MTSFLYRYRITWLLSYIVIESHDFLPISLSNHMTSFQYRYRITWLLSYIVIESHDFFPISLSNHMTSFLYRYRITWLLSYIVIELHDFFPISLSNYITVKQQSLIIFTRSRSAYYNIYARRQGSRFSFSMNLRSN